MIDQLLVLFLVFFKILFGLLAMGHIACDTPKTDSLAVFISN